MEWLYWIPRGFMKCFDEELQRDDSSCNNRGAHFD